MDKWNSMLSVWNKVSVPEVVLEPNNAKTDYTKGVWFDLKNNKKQMNFMSNPIDETASSLLSLRGFDPEFTIAFKLLAFVKMHRSSAAYKVGVIVTKVLSKKGLPEVGNWRGNSHYVLPITFNERAFGVSAPFVLNEMQDIMVLVEQAAKLWVGLANNISLLEPPILLTDNTDVDRFTTDARNGQCPVTFEKN